MHLFHPAEREYSRAGHPEAKFISGRPETLKLINQTLCTFQFQEMNFLENLVVTW